MITQLLGVALISLLTITPTIQQNNIEQLIAPNIEIQPMLFNNLDPNRLLVVNQFSYYSSGLNISTYVDSTLITNFDSLSAFGTNFTYDTFDQAAPNRFIYIDDNTFYISRTTARTITGDVMRDIIRNYYIRTKGSITSQSFSFTNTTDNISETSTFYTYSINGTGGLMNGNIYFTQTSNVSNINSITKNNSVTVNQNITLQNLIQQINPQINWTYSDNRYQQKILFYYFDSSIPLNTPGNYNRSLYARDNYGYVRNFGSVNIQINAPDTIAPVITGPSSLSFEVGTYQLIEQILNNFYIITDEPNDDWNWNIIGSYNLSQVGTYNISIRAFDSANNETIYPIQLNITAPPPNDTTPPVIIGSDTITRQLGQINNDGQLINQFEITDDITLSSAINKTLTGTRSYTESGTYSLTLTATDQAGNIATKQFTFIINAPVIDNEPPVIDSDLIVSITIGDFTDRQEILDFYTTVTDNIALSSVLLVGDIDFNIVGDYELQIIATDTSQNQSTRNMLLRIKEEVILGNYNPLTDLLSGIFGGALSMIFTIGTINVLGLRLLDAMGVIILGAVLLFVYKAIKGGS
jgi:hypothetical protein